MDDTLTLRVEILQNAMQVVGAFSAVFSSAVLLTAIVFKEMFKKKIFFEIICLIALCDVIGSVFLAIGFPMEQYLCFVQGFVISFFFRASWFFTLVMATQLYGLVIYGRPVLKRKVIHWGVWGVSCVLQLFLLSQNSYGQDDELIGR